MTTTATWQTTVRCAECAALRPVVAVTKSKPYPGGAFEVHAVTECGHRGTYIVSQRNLAAMRGE